MITDELLERGLGDIADGYDVPPQAIDDILDQLRPADAVAPDDTDVETSHRRWPPSRHTWLLSSAAAVVVLILVAFIVGGGHNDGSPSAGGKVTNTVSDRENAAGVGADGSVKMMSSGPGSAPGGGTVSVPAAVPPRPAVTRDQFASGGGSTPSVVPSDSLTKIVQTGSMDLQVDKGKVDGAVVALTKQARVLGGFVASSQSVGGDEPSASVTLRVPNSSFPDLLAQARGLGKVLSVDTKSADVTAQYVDLQARLHALGLTKSTYLNILTKASTIGEILSVQQRVNDIQTQIDQLQGQLKVLTDQTSYATLTVSIDQKTSIKSVVVHHQSGLGKAVDRSVSRFVHGVEAIIGVIGPIVLVLLLVALGWLLAKVGYRIVRRQMV